ncbi:phosphotransferase [Thalassotalea sp. M1531]|uniref:Phosphotransferase n=1 Tax=Thalassotalea algicola TaxID=2716224 RepID=A0A7Y0L9X6_9GAMM|nr:phosphotransferase [Thalassotalea algicola]NMP30308.1 phosphotransferase [Thalassotalea algicola]
MSLEQANTRLVQWLHQSGYPEVNQLVPMTGDAGFRQYYRFNFQSQSYLAVDSPPTYCNNEAFFNIASYLKSVDMQVPAIYAKNLEQGFFCIEDFGQCLLAEKLSTENMKSWYSKAIAELPKLALLEPLQGMPKFDAAFVALELKIFTEWLIGQYLSLSLSSQEQQELKDAFKVLTDNILAQPQVFMHRDFHSRNIMVLADESLGIIDFQDAVVGPITYDVVSLLRDCYVKWPQKDVLTLFKTFTEVMNERMAIDIDFTTWKRWFDLTGLQRHIKASGIFARLLLRDNKSSYIKDIPLTLSYIVDIASQYPELSALAKLVENKVLPAVKSKLA